jgi:hypothetical protein
MASTAHQLAVLETASRANPPPVRRRVGRRASNPRNALRKTRPATTAARQGPRSLQTDPTRYGDGPNIYAYVHGDPVNGTDPEGTDDCSGGGDGFDVGCGIDTSISDALVAAAPSVEEITVRGIRSTVLQWLDLAGNVFIKIDPIVDVAQVALQPSVLGDGTLKSAQIKIANLLLKSTKTDKQPSKDPNKTNYNYNGGPRNAADAQKLAEQEFEELGGVDGTRANGTLTKDLGDGYEANLRDSTKGSGWTIDLIGPNGIRDTIRF